MRINHNIAALNTLNQLSINGNNTQKALQKLSSGLRINSAADDAAGLAISEKMRAQIRGLDMAQRNAQDGISLLQTAEGALNETHSILQRMRELAVQSANGTNEDVDREQLQKEIDQLAKALDDISDDTEFNTKKLLDGKFSGTFQVGANKDQNLSIQIGKMDSETLKVNGKLTAASDQTVKIGDQDTDGQYDVLKDGDKVVAVWQDADTNKGIEAGYYSIDDFTDVVDDPDNPTNHTLTLNKGAKVLYEGDKQADGSFKAYTDGDVSTGGIDISSQKAANNAIETINNAIQTVSSERSKIGAVQNRLEHTINNLGTSSQNLTAAESRIRDVDMAKEMMEFTKNNILNQAAQAMLAQSNNLPQGVLQLLR